MRLVLLILCITLKMIESKCPESRKPHSTSCTVFYSCVNLSGGGYVWVPSKCSEGLIFEPSLRICVLPGDSWTCDNIATEPSIITNRYEIPELINPNETSYMGSTEDPLNFSELIDSSYMSDSIANESEEMVTAYPLIEIEDATEDTHESSTDNITEVDDQYKDYLLTQSDDTKQQLLNQLVQQLLIHKQITIPLHTLLAASLSTPSTSNTKIPLYDEVSVSKPNQQSVLMNYLIQNYIQQNNNLQNNIISNDLLRNKTVEDKTIMQKIATNTPRTETENPNSTPSTVLHHSDEENNIILITDTVGNKQYVTIEKYKSLNYQLDPQFVHLVPCLRNVRMVNTTNCLKYYMCDPETASVLEYSCPLFTAFNTNLRLCDADSYKRCIRNKDIRDDLDDDDDNVFDLSDTDKNKCTEHGKMKDPTHDSRYYICYSTSGNSHDIKSIRMTCPNDLIFCQTKKVCTTRRLCKRI